MKIKKKTKVLVICVTCPNCLDTIYSRAVHDFHYCSCGQISVDGGFDYLHYGGKIEEVTPFKKYIMNETRDSLYDDWNKQINKFGKISPEGRTIKNVSLSTTFWLSYKSKKLINRSVTKELNYMIDYTIDKAKIELKKTPSGRKDYRIGNFYFTTFQDVVIKYEFEFKRN